MRRDGGSTVAGSGRGNVSLHAGQKEERLRRAGRPFERYLVLPWAANAAFETEELPKAAAYAGELLRMAADDPGAARNSSAYGMAVFYGHMAAGRVALRLGDVDSARSELLLSGVTPGAPVLNRYGPSMALANEPISRRGGNRMDRETALKFLDECRSFWKPDILDCRSREIEAGDIPAFGGALHRY